MKTNCADCKTTIAASEAVTRSISLERVVLCVPCAKDRGWTLAVVRPASAA
jgi:hypothetical protein